MIKSKELTDPNSCLNRAADDEIIFVLLERDVATPHAITEWGKERVLRGKNQPDDAQIMEALECAAVIAKRHNLADNDGNSFSHNKAIHATFPDPVAALTRLGLELGTSPGTLLVKLEEAGELLHLFQRDTINALANCLVQEAGRLEAINGLVAVEDLKRHAQALRDYADTLVPTAPEGNR